MKRLSSGQIRQMYLDFFKQKGHTVEPSASLIPHDDPSLLWINSGVATMKKYFDGEVVPPNRRLTSSQKSIRTNDIENVGKTARHQTLFEMLGNFSVGDYFKKEAIAWAGELLMSKDWFDWDYKNLYVTIYPKDTDSKKYWIKAGILPDHIIGVEDNFWDVGQGPSGPDSEVFYDRGPKFTDLSDDDAENYPGGENNRYLEVWNIVFSQFNHEPDGSYRSLPRKNIDTGMGLERVVSIFQNAPTNFETDLFLPIIHKVESISQKQYGKNNNDDVSFKIIADHIRAISFAINDGALPSNVGRGYVIRRLIRRAIVSGHYLGIKKSFLYRLVSTVGEIMKPYYPEVLQQSDYISKVVYSEEQRFDNTLADGLKLLNSLIDKMKQSDNKVMSGEDAFKLYDTYGFPLELTQEYVHDEDLKVDQNGFNKEMEKQRQRARNARGEDHAMGIQHDLLVDIKSPSKYVGYKQLNVKNAQLSNIIVDNKLVNTVNNGIADVIFDKTPFYAEMGGQVGDHGVIKDLNNNVVAKVTDVQSAPNGQHLHKLQVIKPLQKNTKYNLSVDRIFHSKVEKNHTATHLLDQTLRNVLGGHTKQAGSLVEPNYLRFDFTHFGQITSDDLKKVENIINQKIFEEIPVKTTVTDQETGKKMGAIALFDSKYGDKVRVVSIDDYSVEFCGGTHVKNTNELGIFKIVSESGVGAGVRRIEAVTSSDAFKLLNEKEDVLQKAAYKLKVNQVQDVPSRVDQLQSQIDKLQDKQESLAAKIAKQQANQVFNNVKTVNDKKIITGVINVDGMNQLRQLADTWRSKQLSDILVLGTEVKGKANLIVAMNETQIKQGLKAGDMIKSISSNIQGGGGGRPNMAQAGGKKPSGLNDAMKAAINWLSNK